MAGGRVVDSLLLAFSKRGSVAPRSSAVPLLPKRLARAFDRQEWRGASSVATTARTVDQDSPGPALGEPPRRCETSSASKSPTHVYSALPSRNDECLDYVRGWAWQQLLLNRRLASRRQDPQGHDDNEPDVVMLLEHQHVYTLGRGADERHLTFLGDSMSDKGGDHVVSPNRDSLLDCRARLARTARGPGSARLSLDRRHSLLGANSFGDDSEIEVAVEHLCQGTVPVRAPNGVPIYRVERGGECTYHGPGQLVVYPMLDLKRQPKADLHDYLRRLEEVVIETLRVYDIDGFRDEVNTGVWVRHRKVAAVGVSSSRWITTHGFALNVDPDLNYFDTSVILPCGIEGRGVTSIREILAERGEQAPTVRVVSRVVLEQLTRVFHLDVEMRRDLSANES